MLGMVKGSSLSAANASAPLTVPVAAVLVHRESAQAQGHQLRRARQAAVLQQLAVPPLPLPSLRQRRQLPMVVLKL
jgi:hypothetical protein